MLHGGERAGGWRCILTSSPRYLGVSAFGGTSLAYVFAEESTETQRDEGLPEGGPEPQY